MTTPRRSERGAALVIVLGVLTLLTVMGLIALQAIAVDLDAAGAERGADQAMYIAEAGLHWALQDLDLTYGFEPTNPDYSPITALPVVTASDPWGPSQIVGWHQLHSAELFRDYGAGSYRVVAKPADPPDNKTLLVRCLARVPGGARRLVEVAVTPTAP